MMACRWCGKEGCGTTVPWNGDDDMGEARQRGTEAERAAEARQRDDRWRQVQELKLQHACLGVLVRREGRIRITRRDLAEVEPGSRIELTQDDLGVTLTFVPGDRA
jgi:SRSO17 transposase